MYAYVSFVQLIHTYEHADLLYRRMERQTLSGVDWLCFLQNAALPTEPLGNTAD